MKELDKSTVRDYILTEGSHHFHESAFLSKRAGVSYIVYADISRVDAPTCLGYATSKSPFGPYKYGGVTIDNNNCNPGKPKSCKYILTSPVTQKLLKPISNLPVKI